jgi:Family of unknown function (DUF6188)
MASKVIIMSTNYLSQKQDTWILPLKNAVVSCFNIDYELKLVLTKPSYEATLVISGEFELQAQEQILVLSAERLSEISPVFKLLSKFVKHSQTDVTGNLTIDFDEEIKLIVKAHPVYEAWQFFDSLGQRVISSPSGELITWSA